MQTRLCIAFIGCGNMGAALLLGLLDANDPEDETVLENSTVFRFIATTRTSSSASNLKSRLGRHSNRVEILHGENRRAIEQADVVVLGVKPHMAEAVLQRSEVSQHLGEKLIISLLAGTSVDTLQGFTHSSATADSKRQELSIVRAIPNLAAEFRQSLTILEQREPALPGAQADLVERIFQQVGQSLWLPTDLVNVGTVLATGCIATLSVPLDGLLDGSVYMGLRRPEAMKVVRQSIASFAALLANGAHPAVMRENISSPRGCTIKTLLTVEKGGTRATFAQSLIDGVEHLDRLQ